MLVSFVLFWTLDRLFGESPKRFTTVGRCVALNSLGIDWIVAETHRAS